MGGMRRLFIAPVLFSSSLALAQVPSWLPHEPGKAQAQVTAHNLVLANKALRAEWRTSSGGPALSYVKNLYTGDSTAGEPATLVLRTGDSIKLEGLRPNGAPRIERLKPNPRAPRAADRIGGLSVRMALTDPSSGLRVDWRAELRDGSNYVREEAVLKAGAKPVDIRDVQLLALAGKQMTVVGSCQGSPLVSRSLFFGMEFPMAASKAADNRGVSKVVRLIPIQPGQGVAYSAVLGVAPESQMRRGVLRYVERERAHPYHPFLHYNSWYDLACGARFDEKGCLDRINAIGQELVVKRGVKLSSYLFDDGWDDTKSQWEFHAGFPQGFANLKTAAAKYGANPGAWLSPWGGYGYAREERLAFGRSHGLEVDSQGYALSGPKYYKRFREVCLDFVNRYGVNQFKIDGTGSPDKQYPGSAFASDFEAAIALIGDLRKARPDLFVNLTTGTWPSPFWTRFADSIWRGGYDHGFAGVGTKRQQWITYRDGATYGGVVKRGPLYPLNALMLHGLIYANIAHDLQTDPGNDVHDEIWSYFGDGTQLQELYITPKLLTKENWDDLAKAAKWSQANADVFVDTHWVGGDPTRLEVYGWASWSPRKGILVLRNPSDKPQAYSIDLSQAFELPKGAKVGYRLTSPLPNEGVKLPLDLPFGSSKVVDLAPFQVLVLEAKPR